MLIMAQSKTALLEHLATAINLLVSLGFIINLDKSVHQADSPNQVLGISSQFHLDEHFASEQESPSDSAASKEAGTSITDQTRSLAQLLGLMVAAHAAILPAPLYYRQLEKQKSDRFNHRVTTQT